MQWFRVSALALAAAAAGATVAPHAAAAPASKVNDTGITTCVDAIVQADIPCGSTGQDAEYGRDLTQGGNADGRLGLRFEKVCGNGDSAGTGSCPAKPKAGSGPTAWACTRDLVTGLTWERKTGDGTAHDGQRTYTQYSTSYDPPGEFGSAGDAAGFVLQVNSAGLCGASDWRLPSAAELQGLVDMSSTALPAADTRFFPNLQSNAYWAAGAVESAASLGWTTNFGVGMGAISREFRSSLRPAMLVRGGSAPVPRFVTSPDGQYVRDLATGLDWRRCIEGLSFNGTTCAGTAVRLTWPEALARARSQSGWRMPNIKELASLLDHAGGREIDAQAFPGPQGTAQWSASPLSALDRQPACVVFSQGYTGICNAFTPFEMRFVRQK